MPFIVGVIVFLLLSVFIKRGISYVIGLVLDGIEFILYDVMRLPEKK